MLDCINYPLSFPSYSSVAGYEGKGNYAVSKYYQYPWRWLYRHKVRMIERALRGNKFELMLNFGSGPGILDYELYKYTKFLVNYDIGCPEINGRYDIAVCASVMEFVSLKDTFEKLSQHTEEIIVTSPMKTSLSDYYFRLIEDKHQRHPHQDILENMVRYFSINYYRSWCGLYFCARGIRK